MADLAASSRDVRGEGPSGVSLLRVFIQFKSPPDHLSKPPPPNTSAWGLGFQQLNRGGGVIQTFGPQQSHHQCLHPAPQLVISATTTTITSITISRASLPSSTTPPGHVPFLDGGAGQTPEASGWQPLKASCRPLRSLPRTAGLRFPN